MAVLSVSRRIACAGSAPSSRRLLACWVSSRSGSLLERKVNDTDSEILRHYLKGDFPGTFELVRRFWEGTGTNSAPIDSALPSENRWVIEEVIRCIGFFVPTFGGEMTVGVRLQLESWMLFRNC